MYYCLFNRACDVANYNMGLPTKDRGSISMRTPGIQINLDSYTG